MSQILTLSIELMAVALGSVEAGLRGMTTLAWLMKAPKSLDSRGRKCNPYKRIARIKKIECGASTEVNFIIVWIFYLKIRLIAILDQ